MHTLNRRSLFLGTVTLGALGALGVAGAPPARAADNSRTAYDHFRTKGLSAAQSAGLVGNFIVESGKDPIDPTAKQYGGGPGRGIAQWEGSRRDDLYAYADSRGLAWSNLGLQLDFVWRELSGTESHALQKIRATSTPATAAVAVRRYYERPSAHADQARINAAELVYSRYSGSTPPSETALPTLRKGSSGSAVITLQHLLRSHGHSLAVDGTFGPATEDTVLAFQQAEGLAADGVVGPRTWMAVLVVLRSGSEGHAVRGLQTELRASGADIEVDGTFGSPTLAAVKAYQKSTKLDIDGVVGPATWGSLID